ncbi:MAG TPA: DUF418 domain-containing protein [Sphingomicrobium sp.]|nr:DUF418 domain-containing protein [Sphingomicrobium sp.]
MDQTSTRFPTLDIIRGVAVLGILAMNIVAFAMPPAAYINPLAYGTQSTADLISYAFSFVFVDGKMRGLFSFLFGASLLLVATRAEQAGDDGIANRRLVWLLLFGCLHFYLVWYGDILIGYALTGFLALLCRNWSVRRLLIAAAVLITIQLLLFIAVTWQTYQAAATIAGPNADPAALAAWERTTRDVGVPRPERLAETMALYLGPWGELVRHQVQDKLLYPFVMTFVYGWETLGYMLLGMTGLKSGFLAGEWSDERYRRWATGGLAVSIAAYLTLLVLLFRDGFSVPGLFALSFTATVPFRPIMVAAYAALIILATRRGGWLVDRLAAAGRAAFTNYLGTSLLMTAFFYGWGLGQFGTWSRVELWLVVLSMWAIMLAWSKPWLERYRYGPFEWLWRSLSRGRVQPLRRPAIV